MRNILFILLFLGIHSTLTAQENETLVKTGMEVPDFTVKMFDGQTVQMKELRGKVVLLNFWATWCPPCRMELARVEKTSLNDSKIRTLYFFRSHARILTTKSKLSVNKQDILFLWEWIRTVKSTHSLPQLPSQEILS